MSSEDILKEIESFLNDFSNEEKNHDDYLRSYRDVIRNQERGVKSLKHFKYTYTILKQELKKLEKFKFDNNQIYEKFLTLKKKFLDVETKLIEMERELPASSNGIYLSIILGSNLNISLLNPDDRYRYKQEYESFKLKITYIILAIFLIAYLFPFRAVDALCNFLLVWYYCTLTIRESILRVNGSRIKGWWVFHHYISCILCGITLTWKDSDHYQRFRPLFILLVCYVGTVQLLQTKYQKECLRRLHALGQRYSMDITVEGFTSWQFKGLTFLLPFLVGGYVIQGYCSYYLFYMYLKYDCSNDWQVIALAFLFAFVTLGNMATTMVVVYRKYANCNKTNQLVSQYCHKFS